ncbi:MAG: phospholipase D family protein [Cyclobacteriaceae bacterium]
MKSFLLCITIFISACSSEGVKYELFNEDFCSQIDRHEFLPLSKELEIVEDSLNTMTGVHVLEEGDMSMVYRAWLSESAEKSIDIQYFIFSADNIGLIAIDYLIRAADRGVKVRMIVDDIMVEADSEDLLALDAHPNVSIKIYNPTANIGKSLPQKLYSLTIDFRGFNSRMHNKTFIVDEQAVITGGRNIADEYFDYDHEYNFRDRDVLLMGADVKQVSTSFLQFWESTLSVPIGDLASEMSTTLSPEQIYEYLNQYACNPANFWPEIREKISRVPEMFHGTLKSGEFRWQKHISYVSDMPTKNDQDTGLSGGGLSTDSLIALIDSAKKSIYIQSPYLVTTELSQELFRRAIARGVVIKILTNSLISTDNLEAFSGYQRERETLLEIGIELFEFRPDAAVRLKIMTGALQRKLHHRPKFGLHAKSMVVDGEVAVIGTFNLDPRSANLNTECIAIIRDEIVASKLLATMEEEIQPDNAWKTTFNSNPDAEASFAKRFQSWTRNVVPKSIL